MDFVSIIIFLTQVVTLATAVLAFWVGRRNKTAIDRVEINIDGRLTELLEITRKSSHAQGMKDQKDSQ